jgi:hypothetical protein
MAQRGNLAAIREVLDRADGKAITRLAGAEGEPPITLEDRIPEHLRTPEQRRKFLDERLFEILKGVCERGGFRLVKVPIKKPLREQSES